MDYQKIIIVVARYNENLDWLRTIPWKYIVYNKGEDNLPKWIKNEVKLPNIGKEAHTWLTYIINNYDNLPDYTIFVQGHPFDHSTEIIKRITDFDGGDDFFSLVDKHLYSDGHGNRHHPGLKVAEAARKIFLDDNIQSFSFSGDGQFILSKKTILFHSKLTYQKIIDFMIEGNSSNEVCTNERHQKNCKCKTPFSAWVMERLWETLFDNEHKAIYDEL